MEEVLYLRKKCKSQADISQEFFERFQGKIHKVGRSGLMGLFFPKIDAGAVASRSSKGERKIHSSFSYKNKEKNCLSLPRVNKTAGQLNQAKRNKIIIDRNCPSKLTLVKDQRQKLKI